MEPRGKQPWNGLYRYLGGVGKYDLYLDSDGDVRVVDIGRPFEWGYVAIKDGKVDRFVEDGDVSDESKVLIIQYIRLFAPGILAEEPCNTDG